jgi:hypothetical protein
MDPRDHALGQIKQDLHELKQSSLELTDLNDQLSGMEKRYQHLLDEKVVFALCLGKLS